jgi:uncharacterized protein YndB with AHSA1/START domain
MTEANTATRSVIIERVMPHPPEKIWRALTQGPLIEEWLMKNDFMPIVGHRFNLHSTPRPDVNIVLDCQVLVVDPGKTLSYTWVGLGLETVITWTLTPTSAGTYLRMEQSGFRSDQRQAYGGARSGWPRMLEKLEQVLVRTT